MAKSWWDNYKWWVIVLVIILIIAAIFFKSESPSLSARGGGIGGINLGLNPGDNCNPQNDQCAYGCSCTHYDDGYQTPVCCSAPADTPCTKNSQCSSGVCLNGYCQDGKTQPYGCCNTDQDCFSGPGTFNRCIVAAGGTSCSSGRICSNYL